MGDDEKNARSDLEMLWARANDVRAREQAAGLAGGQQAADRIRAMTDERARGGQCTCGAPDPRQPETLQAAHYAGCPHAAK